MLKLSAITTVLLVTGVVTAMASATTEIDRADATFHLKGRPTKIACVGEDSATPYTQYTATYKGGEADLSPAVPTDPVTGGLDHGLTGTLKWKAVITFNNLTGRGVAQGLITLTSPDTAGAVKVFSGPLTLIVQRDPAGQQSPFMGRGWLNAATFDKSGKRDGAQLANVEVQFSPDLTTIDGLYGEAAWPLATGPVPPFSVQTGLSDTC